MINSRIIRIHISDDISSLSAIMLNDDFYEFMINGRKTVDGVSVLSAEYIIPFYTGLHELAHSIHRIHLYPVISAEVFKRNTDAIVHIRMCLKITVYALHASCSG